MIRRTSSLGGGGVSRIARLCRRQASVCLAGARLGWSMPDGNPMHHMILGRTAIKFAGLQGPSRSRRDLSSKTCWRAMFICILRARRSRWQPPWLRAAARSTLRRLAVLRLRLPLELRAPQAEAVIMPSLYRSGMGWCTLRLSQISVLGDACTHKREEGAVPETKS
jgi:hypothetical protein